MPESIITQQTTPTDSRQISSYLPTWANFWQQTPAGVEAVNQNGAAMQSTNSNSA